MAIDVKKVSISEDKKEDRFRWMCGCVGLRWPTSNSWEKRLNRRRKRI